MSALARDSARRHHGAIPSVQIKDVPPETHAVLVRRAAAAHQLLQECLRSRLIEEAAQPTMREVLERITSRKRVPLTASEAANLVREERESHDASLLVLALLDTEAAEAHDVLASPQLCAPELIDLDVGAALRRQVLRGHPW